MYEYKAKILNVVDGDTFDMDIDLGFNIKIQERIRVLDLDTPEKRGSEEKELGLLVTAFAKDKFEGKDVVIHSHKMLTPTTDSFGRWLAEVVIEDGEYKDRSVADIYTEMCANKLSDNYSAEKVMSVLS